MLNEPGPDPLASLNAFLAKGLKVKGDMAPAAWDVFGALFRPENQVLYQRIVIAWEALFRPALTEIIPSWRQGKSLSHF